MWIRPTAILTSVLLLSACSGGGNNSNDVNGSNTGGSNGNPVTVVQGVLLDAEVGGVRFETPTQSGVTDTTGTFDYVAGEVISFYIGDILLGSTTGTDTITPINFVPGASDEMNQHVTNILRFIQSLDSDSDLTNGIQISAASRTALIGQLLDFSLSKTDFENAFNSLSGAVLGGVTLVSAEDAQAHMRATLDALNGGGTTVGDPGGDFGSVTLSGADTSVFGTRFVPTSVSVTSIDVGVGTVSWNSGNTDASNTGIVYGINAITLDGQFSGVKFGYQDNVDFHLYEIDCMNTISPDCDKINFDKVTKQLTLTGSVVLSIQDLPGLDNLATDSITLTGTVTWQ